MKKSLLVWFALVAGVLGVLSGPVSPGFAAGDGNEASCSNEALEGFRVYLPDCRAYEMVTPPFKDGGHNMYVGAVSVDGSRVLSNTTGVFVGAPADINSYGAYYVFSRSGSGWIASAVSPSQALFPAQEFWAADPGLGRSLWAMHSPSQGLGAMDLYVREGDGSLVRVGPMVPPSLAAGPPVGAVQAFENFSTVVYRGASSDLSRVLFRATENVRWPGDTTKQETVDSLYEYAGTGNSRPELVGVDGEGRLISDCETSLGSNQSKDAYNAVSGGGGAVFFTAVGHRTFSGFSCREGDRGPEVSELYARLDGVETVSISEPSLEDCVECQTGVATPRHPAVVEEPAEFQGASQDGSKVFFLSEQELLEGAKGMNLYEYDFNNPEGSRVLRVSTGSVEPLVQGVARVSEDGSHVYFVARGVLTEGANGEGREPVAGGENMYVFERDATYPAGHLAFVATLSEEDQEDWREVDFRPVQATPDGRFLVFQSAADLTAGDTSSEQQVFEYDAQTERLVRVSVGQAGYASGMANADTHSSSIPIQEYIEQLLPTAAATRLAVSADGSRVVFSSIGALTPDAETAAVAGAGSTYEYRSVGSIANGNVYLISDGTNTLNAKTFGLDASGQDVFFGTADPLLSQDGDNQYDFYDARSGGGFPAPAVTAGCVGEGCQGAASGPVSFGSPGSVSSAGGGNLSPPVSAPVVAPRAKAPTRAQKLAGALKRCRSKPRRKRRVCEAQARKRYAGRANVNTKGKG